MISSQFFPTSLCGVLVFDSVSRVLLLLFLLLPPSSTLCPHTLCPHTLCPRTLCPHTLCPHTLHTHTNTLTHTHTLGHTHFVHTHFTHTHTLCPHTLCPHTLCQHTLCPHTLCPHTLHTHTLWHTHTYLATHTLSTHTSHIDTLHAHTHTHTHTRARAHTHTHIVLRGRRGTDGTGWRPWAGIGRLWRRGTLRGRRGTTSHLPSFHVAGVAQCYIHRRFAWQAWDRWHWVAPLGRDWAPVTPRHFAWQAWHNLTSTFVSRGRRGTMLHPPSFCVAGVALMVLGGALGPGLGACDAAALCVAGVAQPEIHLRFTWQAWHKLASTVVLRGRRGTYGTGRGRRGTDGTGWRPWAGIGRLWRRGTLRGRRGTTSHPPSFHVAGVAQCYIHRRFAWQAWHLWYWVAPLGRDWAPVMPRHFAWQAWHNLTSTFVSRGRRGTMLHPPSFCVAGVALMVLGGALGPGLGACDAAALCVAGVAQTRIHRRFAWQAWHLW